MQQRKLAYACMQGSLAAAVCATRRSSSSSRHSPHCLAAPDPWAAVSKISGVSSSAQLFFGLCSVFDSITAHNIIYIHNLYYVQDIIYLVYTILYIIYIIYNVLITTVLSRIHPHYCNYLMQKAPWWGL